jgi:hypothetical protein
MSADPARIVLSRRAFLGATAAVVAGGLAGCTKEAVREPAAAPVEPVAAPRPPAPSARQVPVAEARGPAFTLVERSAWAERAPGAKINPMGEVTRITVHHTGEYGKWAELPDIQVVRQIENYHRMNTPHKRAWACIGYHFLVGRDGRIYEGRPARFQGAHTSGANANNLGISVIGDFMRREPSERQLRALAAFLDDRRALYKVGKARIFGHRDLSPSQCPGDALYAWLRRWKAAS